MLSLKIDPDIHYPSSVDFFSPDESYPEYPYQHLARQPNSVYRAVRSCFAQAGLDEAHFGTAHWNPLGAFIQPADRVFVLCNFANERRVDEKLEDYYSRCTHGSVLRAVLDYVLIAVKGGQTVRFGNAPTQACHWDAVLRDTGAQPVLDFYTERQIPVEAVDLRLFVLDSVRSGAVRGVERRHESGGVMVDLGSKSLMTELDQFPNARYRVMFYNPKRTEQFHSSGRHTYVIAQPILASDVIFSVPKFKTHEKVGISCALKGFVGTVAHKDSLPHHRYGTPQMHGDEYPRDPFGLLRLASAFHERVQQIPADTSHGSALRVGYKTFRWLARHISPISEGAWWGNDTAWRMVHDVLKVATYASASGEMQPDPCRRHLVMIDGILGGEGEGPAYCSALPCGYLLFSDDLVLTDFINAALMGFDSTRILLIRQAMGSLRDLLRVHSPLEEQVFYNGQPSTLEDLQRLSPFYFEPAPGWVEKLGKPHKVPARLEGKGN